MSMPPSELLSNYALLSQSGIQGGSLTINGPLGTVYGSAGVITTSPISGTATEDQINVGAATTELRALIVYINGLTPTTPFVPAATVTLLPGVYTVSDVTFPGVVNLVFDANNDQNAQFFIRSGLSIDLTTVTMVLTNGAQANNIYWSAYSKITFAATSPIYGNLIAETENITFDATSLNVNGRILTAGTAVTFAGPTVINDPNICYLKGSKILCKQGYVAVEDLKVGDLVIKKGKILNNSEVVFEDSLLEPITWINSYRAANIDEESIPVCIKKGAFGKNTPSEDLFVSPGHRIVHEGKLLVASELINGKSIVNATSLSEIVYYHFELYDHSVVDANGLLSETFLEIDNSSKVFNNV